MPSHTSSQDWPTRAPECRALQKKLADQIRLAAHQSAVRWIGGVDVGFPARGRRTLAAVGLLNAETLALEYSARAVLPTRMPYVPGLLSFRELPAALDALASLPVSPDLLMVDGQGIAHPRGIGTASHLGLVTGIPAIGVGKSRLVGTYQVPDQVGQACRLNDNGAHIGYVLKSRARANPLFISPGHGINHDQALNWVRYALTGYRLPEPTRLADALSRDGRSKSAARAI